MQQVQVMQQEQKQEVQQLRQRREEEEEGAAEVMQRRDGRGEAMHQRIGASCNDWPLCMTASALVA